MYRFHPAWFSIGTGALISYAAITASTSVTLILVSIVLVIAASVRSALPIVAIQLLFGLSWSTPALFLDGPLGPTTLRDLPNTHLSVCGTTDSVRRRTTNGGVILLDALEIEGKTFKGRLRLTSQTHRALPTIGQRVCQSLKVQSVRPHFNPGGDSFETIWLNRNVRLTARSYSKSGASLPTHVLTDMREAYRDRIHAPKVAHMELLEAMILGDSGVLEPSDKARFRRTGTSHLLAISGLHVGLIAIGVFAIARILVCWFCPWFIRKFTADAPAAVMASAAAFIYVAIAGGPASAQRAAWMVTALGFARVIARRPDSVGALSFAFSIMLAGAPHRLLDPSIQLSFGAVGAVLLGYKRGYDWIVDKTMRWSFRTLAKGAQLLGSSLWISLLCTMGSLPAALYHFDTFAPVGLLVNVVAIPITAYGLVTPGMLWLIWTSLSSHPGLLDDLFRTWVNQGGTALVDVTAWAAIRPWHTRETLLCLAVSLGCLALVSGRFHTVWRSNRTALLRSLAVLAALICGWLIYRAELVQSSPLRITFLDVGHGDCVVIHRGDSHGILVDTGGDPSGYRAPGKRVVVPALRALGIQHLDAVIISHAHPDHYLGLDAVLQEFPTSGVWFNGQTPDDSAWASITHRLTAAGIPLRIAHKAIQLPGRWKDVDLALLPRPAPAGFRTDWSENENSLVLSLQFGRFSAIFTGDIEQKAERFLLPYLHRIDLLKVAHHGSATSSSDAFLQAVRPRLAIAQSNDGGRYNLPNPRIEARYKQHRIPFWVTGRCGAVQIQTNGDGFSIEPYAPNDYLRTFCPL